MAKPLFTPERGRPQIEAAPEPISRAYLNYALALLVVVNVFNYLDRQILSILLEPIKRDLQLSDTALGFLPAFMMRVHGMTNTAELGLWLGLIAGVFSGMGTFLGGAVSDRLAARRGDTRWYLWLPAGATLLGVPFSFLLYLWPEGRMALLLSIPGSILGPMWLGPTAAMTQGLVKLRMRATASAILLFIINLIGLGLGPQTVGSLSDLLAPSYGKEAIRYALLSVSLPGVCGQRSTTS